MALNVDAFDRGFWLLVLVLLASTKFLEIVAWFCAMHFIKLPASKEEVRRTLELHRKIADATAAIQQAIDSLENKQPKKKQQRKWWQNIFAVHTAKQPNLLRAKESLEKAKIYLNEGDFDVTQLAEVISQLPSDASGGTDLSFRPQRFALSLIKSRLERRAQQLDEKVPKWMQKSENFVAEYLPQIPVVQWVVIFLAIGLILLYAFSFAM